MRWCLLMAKRVLSPSDAVEGEWSNWAFAFCLLFSSQTTCWHQFPLQMPPKPVEWSCLRLFCPGCVFLKALFIQRHPDCFWDSLFILPIACLFGKGLLDPGNDPTRISYSNSIVYECYPYQQTHKCV